jgi:signal transduction histidine kinase/CheY-like chemotaxis protein
MPQYDIAGSYNREQCYRERSDNVKWMVIVGTLLVLLVYPLHVAYGQTTVNVQDDFQQLSVSPYADYYLDHSGLLSIQQLIELPRHDWFRSQSTSPFFGYSSDSLWLRLPLRNASQHDHHLLLELQYPLLDHVDVYVMRNRGKMERLRLGDTLPFNRRPIDSSNFVIPLNIDSNEYISVYIRIQSTSSLGAPLQLWQYDHYFKSKQAVMVGQGLYYGIILIMILYNLFIYLSVKHVGYLYYIGAAIGCSSYVASVQGIGFQFWWSSYPWVNSVAIPVSLSVFGLMGMLFAISLLHTKQNTPRIHRLFVALAACFFASFVLSFVLPSRSATIMVSVLGMPTTLLVIVCGFYLMHSGVRVARFFVLAWTILLSSVFITGLSKFGLLPSNTMINHSVQFASAVEVVLFSFALADRINEERREKLAAQNAAVKNEKAARQQQKRFLDLKYQSAMDELRSKQNLISIQAENSAKNQFLTTMSHEIRTPLNGVLGMSELMQDTSLNAVQNHYVDSITQSGKALLGVIDDIMDYAKITAGSLDLKVVDVDLEQVCQECLNVFSADAENKQVELLCLFSEDVPSFVQIDPTRLRQIILNLISNAIKFTDRGCVSLRVSSIAPIRRQHTHQIRFDVVDTGIGIAKEVQEKLFQAFNQADLSVAREFGGTGLGLSISKKLAEIMGGEIGVISTPNEGSRFWFSVECLPASKSYVAQHSLPLTPLQNKKLLVVDESFAFSQAIHDQVKAWGMRPLIAREADQAIAMLRNESAEGKPVDIVLVDVKLDSGNGLHCIRQIKEDKDIMSCHCVLVSSACAAKYCSDVRAEEVDMTIQKPLAPRALHAALLNLTQQVLSNEVGVEHYRQHDFEGKSVLVVEDNKVNQLVIRGMLKKLHVDVTIAENGQVALDYIIKRSQRFDLIFMDCEMPVLDGFSATKRLRDYEASRKIPAIPIVALSAHVLLEHQKLALESGMNEHLAKPVDYKRLENTLSKYLGFSTIRVGTA